MTSFTSNMREDSAPKFGKFSFLSFLSFYVIFVFFLGPYRARHRREVGRIRTPQLSVSLQMGRQSSRGTNRELRTRTGSRIRSCRLSPQIRACPLPIRTKACPPTRACLQTTLRRSSSNNSSSSSLLSNSNSWWCSRLQCRNIKVNSWLQAHISS